MSAGQVASGLEQFEAIASIFDAANIVFYVADIDTHELLFLNSHAQQLWGPGKRGARCYEVLQAGQNGPCAFCTNDRLVAAGQACEPVTWEFQNTVTGRWFLCIDKAIRWPDGRLVRMEVAIDISERKAHEQFHEQYVGLISHDLRTPLSAIANSASVLKALVERHELTHGVKQVETILRGTRRMSEMIEDLLETTRLESGAIKLHMSQVDLSELASAVIASFPASSTRPIQLEAAGPAKVLADAGRLERVLENLIGNAVRYSQAGTPVRVNVGEKDDETVVTVADRGVGIPAVDLPKLFERFYRSAHRGRTSNGLGLGLYTSRLIIESHRGRIWADSEVGLGSTFGFALPRKRDRSTLTEAAARTPVGMAVHMLATCDRLAHPS
jgi:two-component system, OmpR family, phosphate regulon sensor histidine kinase PhoR